MIRILHTADWHLGQTFFGYDRTEEHQHFLDWLALELKRNQINALLIAGDIFDVSNPSAASLRMFYRFIHKVTTENPSLQIVMIAGNHDSAARLEAPLPLMEEMRTEIKGIVCRKNGEIDYDQLIVELKNQEGVVEAFCMAVPFLRQGDYPAVQTEGNTYAEGVKELYVRLLNRVMEKRNGQQAIIAMGHLQATGSEIAERDYSERTIIGGLECVSPEAFPKQIAYTALGHIHKSQRVSGREEIRYAGSPLSMSFAERHYRHGVMLVTINEGKVTEIEKLQYDPLVKLISVPEGNPESPDKVLEELSSLPYIREENRKEEQPFLEVKVLLDEPEPMLRQQIEEVLADKPVRLARIVSSYQQSKENMKEDEILVSGLQEMNPLQIVRSVFEDSYHAEMPEELETLFQEACLSVALDGEDKK